MLTFFSNFHTPGIELRAGHVVPHFTKSVMAEVLCTSLLAVKIQDLQGKTTCPKSHSYQVGKLMSEVKHPEPRARVPRNSAVCLPQFKLK